MPDTSAADSPSAQVASEPNPDPVPVPAGDGAAARPSILSRLSLRSKLLLMLLLTSLLSIAITAWIGYQNGSEALTRQSMDQLTSLRIGNKQQFEAYIDNLRQTFRTFGEDVAVVSAIGMFKDGFSQLGKQGLAPERRAALETYYKDNLLAKIIDDGRGIPLLETVMPRTDRALELQSLFIAENPNPVGQKATLVDHPVSNAYTLAHYTYHQWFHDLAERFHFYDLFLIDGSSGEVVYTVAKEVDLGTNLIDGPFARSNLGQLYQQVLREHQRGYVKMSDFDFYLPSYNQQAVFIATPIYSNWKFLGVFAAQISIEQMNRYLNNGVGSDATGLGETGSVYIVGDDRLMRSESRALQDHPDKYLGTLEALSVPKATVERIRALKSAVLLQRVDTEAVTEALQGKSNTRVINGFGGVPVLSSYTPLDLPDLHWALLAERDQAEALAPQLAYARNVVIAACLLGLLTTLGALLMANRFLRPVNALLGGIENLRQGRFEQIPLLAHDEFGQLTKAFNTMSENVRERDALVHSKSRAYEALLRRIFPDVVAERMKKGEGQIVQSFAQVSVLYAMVNGFVQSTEQLPQEDALSLLNELVDTFDAIAEELNIEKVKTIGEHYLAACGISVPRLDHARRVVEFADRMAGELEGINRKRGLALKLRIGIDSGEIQAGLVGSRRFVYDIWGKPLNVARRIVHETELGEVRLTEETFKALSSPADFASVILIKSKTLGEVKTYGRKLQSVTAAKTGKPSRPPRAAE